MRIDELTNAPKWLLEADTINADVDIVDGVVVWRDGEWLQGIFEEGIWAYGQFYGGVFKGDWECGQFFCGSFEAKSCHTIKFIGGLWNTDCEPVSMTSFIANREIASMEPTIESKLRDKVREKIESNDSMALLFSIIERIWKK